MASPKESPGRVAEIIPSAPALPVGALPRNPSEVFDDTPRLGDAGVHAGGTPWVRSEQGSGTHVTVRFPLAAEAAPPVRGVGT
jgi:hypothetical protein